MYLGVEEGPNGIRKLQCSMPGVTVTKVTTQWHVTIFNNGFLSKPFQGSQGVSNEQSDILKNIWKTEFFLTLWNNKRALGNSLVSETKVVKIKQLNTFLDILWQCVRNFLHYGQRLLPFSGNYDKLIKIVFILFLWPFLMQM